ncbi:MAG TPA: pyridoxamine 5'-phosphate oxidase family protein [Arthrobacter sp.]|nr:pyridoxamine 5'-phosphate oxidase family protein [Arthrobacter sp.]
MNLPDEQGRLDGTLHTHKDLDAEQCWELLQSRNTGRLGYEHEGRILIFPVNYMIHDAAIYFRTASKGAIGTATPRTSVSFEIDKANPERSGGWAVLASGPASQVTDPDLLKFLWGRIMPEPWGAGHRDLFICVTPTIITGRSVFLS